MNVQYTLSIAGAAFVRILEGYSAKFYWDAATPPVGTIGIGFTWRSAAFRKWWGINKPGVTFGPGATMTREQADAALIFIMEEEYGKSVEDFFNKTGQRFPQNVFDGTTSPVYNLGAGSLDWKWAQALKAGNIAEAARLLENTGLTAGGKKLKGLVMRRREEAELLRTGDYNIAGHSSVPAASADPMADGMLVKGERGEAVTLLQMDLKTLGFYGQKIDLIFGFGTEQAVLDFQRAKGLKPDGFAGPATLKAIAEALLPIEASLPAPKPAPIPAPQPAPSAGPSKSTPIGGPVKSAPVRKSSAKPLGAVIIGIIVLAVVAFFYFT